jgi:5'-deoxynucleotidase YfbR-like HD superfamily hydrolase
MKEELNMNLEISIQTYKAMDRALKRLNNLRRWTDVIADTRYDEIAKQALNCIICFFLASIAEEKGKVIQWERFPKIAIYRAFQKAYVNYDTPEHILKDICIQGDIQFDTAFKKTTDFVIAKKAGENFKDWLEEGCDTEEEKVYKAATKIATLLELNGLQQIIPGKYVSSYGDIIKAMIKYENIPGFIELGNEESDYFKIVFASFSRLRNQNRWAAYSYQVACSVLGHLFDTGIFAYLMALEKGDSESLATKFFFMGILHDIPEAFTKDIPSPVKERIDGFREATEKYEMAMMEKHVYPFIKDECVKVSLRNHMMEGEQNEADKAFMKGADYMSAVSEIGRQFIAGSRDPELVHALDKHREKFDSGKAKLTPCTWEYYECICKFVKNLHITDF